MRVRSLIVWPAMAVLLASCASSTPASTDASGSTLPPIGAVIGTPKPTTTTTTAAPTTTRSTTTTTTTPVPTTAKPSTTTVVRPTTTTTSTPGTTLPVGPQVCKKVRTPNGDATIEIRAGEVACPFAEKLLDTYFNHPPSQPQGNGAYVTIGEWECNSSSTLSSGVAATCNGPDGGTVIARN